MPSKDGKKWLVCKQCGQVFRGHHGRVYCSDECKEKATPPRKGPYVKKGYGNVTYTKVCEWCGKEFTTKAPNAKYCSSKCSNARRERDRPPKDKPTRECVVCGELFEGSGHEIYCKAHKGFHKCKCAVCGETFYSTDYKARYCSDECRESERLKKLRASVSANVARRYPNCDFDADSYQKAEDPIHLRCRTCGHDFTVSYHTIKPSREGEASGCPKCNETEIQKKREEEEQQKKKWAEQRELEAYMRLENQRLKINAEKAKTAVCKNCGKEFHPFFVSHKSFCSDECARRYANHYHEHLRRSKIKANGNADSSITLEKLYERDNGICQICGITCDWEDKIVTDKAVIAGDTYPSIDHKIPVAKGGQHVWENVQLLCRGCNYEKGDTLMPSV